jgi:hypothetical protein
MRRFVVVVLLGLVVAAVSAAPASAQSDCEGEAKRPAKVVRVMWFKGVATCRRTVDLLHVEVCGEERRRSGHYATRRCRRFTCSNCGSVSGRVFITCRRRVVYRTRVNISGADEGWFFGDLVYTYSGERRC